MRQGTKKNVERKTKSIEEKETGKEGVGRRFKIPRYVYDLYMTHHIYKLIVW